MNWLPMVKHSVSGTMVKYEEDLKKHWRTPLEKRRGRVYSTVVSGLEKFRRAKVRLGFLNLTSYVGFELGRYNYAWTKLRRWLIGYLRDNFDDCVKLRKLDFFRLRTVEGEYGNVFHILIEMPHEIPVFVVANMWFRLTGGTSYEQWLIDKVGAFVVHLKWCYNWSVGS